MIKKLLYEEGFTIKGAVNFIDKNNKVEENKIDIELNNKINHILSLLNEGSNLIKRNLG